MLLLSVVLNLFSMIEFIAVHYAKFFAECPLCMESRVLARVQLGGGVWRCHNSSLL